MKNGTKRLVEKNYLLRAHGLYVPLERGDFLPIIGEVADPISARLMGSFSTSGIKTRIRPAIPDYLGPHQEWLRTVHGNPRGEPLSPFHCGILCLEVQRHIFLCLNSGEPHIKEQYLLP